MPKFLKRFRQSFGISAPRMTVRTHFAWYWRWLGMLLFASVSLALAAWMYDAGRRFAGFDRSEVEQELSRLRNDMAKLEQETSRLRATADAADSKLKIEQAAQAQLAKQARALEDENIRLKEDLAFFDHLLPAADKVSIYRFKVEPDVLPGEYRYRLLVFNGAQRNREFQGFLQLVVSVQETGRNGMMVFPEEAEAGIQGYKLNFKHFQRVEGSFRVSPKAKVLAVQARILENGSNQARVVQSVNLS